MLSLGYIKNIVTLMQEICQFSCCAEAELRNDEADAGLVLGDDAAELSKRSAADRGNCISLWALVLNTELEELQGPSCPP